MELKKKTKRVILNKKVLNFCLIFLFSATNLYGGVYPFGLPAFSVWGTDVYCVITFFAGVMVSGCGIIGLVRHSVAFSTYILLKRYMGKFRAEPWIVGMSVLIGGSLAIILLGEYKTLYLYYMLAEALVSAIMCFVFERSKRALSDKLRGRVGAEPDFAFLIITTMCLFLAFSGIETGRISISASLMLLTGMVSSYMHIPSVSVAVNMAAGFFTMFFTPANVAAVAYLTLSGFFSALLKKYGKFFIPLTYMALFPLFVNTRVNVTTFYLEDVVISSLVFLIAPGRFMKLINMVPGTEKKEASCLKISERINMLSDTFYSISELFSGMEMRVGERLCADAGELAVKEVCSDCYYKGKCSENAIDALKTLEGNRLSLYENNLKCYRKRELLTSFSGISRAIRLQNVWQNHIKEENTAVASQMSGMAEMLKEICAKEEVEIFRSEETEREIVSALRKNGIKVKKIVAGRNGNGIFRVMLEMTPCKSKTFCDEIIPGIIKNIVGIEVIRYGLKRCSSCRVCYTEMASYKVDTALASVSAEDISGDSSKFSYIDAEHFAVVLSDGMGTGAMAKYKSNVASELTLKLLSVGMDIPSAVTMVNSLLLRQGANDFVTLDIACINLETGEIVISKNASAAGYILKCGGKVKELKSCGSPLGIVGETETKIEKYRMSEGDFLIMVSDGVSDCFNGEEKGMIEKIKEFTMGSASELADFIITEALKINGRKVKDDMTVITVGCIKKQKSGKDRDKGGLVYEKRQKSNYFR